MKRRIQEVCGLVNLDKEERLKRAKEILNSVELKQAICNEILGTSHKDVERTMQAILEERRPSKEEQDREELERIAPEKLAPDDIIQKPRKVKKPYYKAMTKEETAALLALSETPITEKKVLPKTEYDTYSREEVEQMLSDYTFKPRRE